MSSSSIEKNVMTRKEYFKKQGSLRSKLLGAVSWIILAAVLVLAAFVVIDAFEVSIAAMREKGYFAEKNTFKLIWNYIKSFFRFFGEFGANSVMRSAGFNLVVWIIVACFGTASCVFKNEWICALIALGVYVIFFMYPLWLINMYLSIGAVAAMAVHAGFTLLNRREYNKYLKTI